MTSMIASDTLVAVAQGLGLLLFLKASLVLLVGGGLARQYQRTSSSSRYSVWCLVLVLLLVLPVATLTLPGWPVLPASQGERTLSSEPVAAVSAAGPGSDATESRGNVSGQVVANEGVTSPGAVETSVAGRGATRPTTSPVSVLAAAFVGLWLAGLLVMAFRLRREMTIARNLIRQGTRQPTERIAAVVQQLRTEFRIRRRVQVRLGSALQFPFSWGIFSPFVVLPLEARDWSQAQLRSVMAHEMAHIARWDHLTLFLGEVARAVYWPNPLVWLAVRQCGREREWSCDDEVLNHGVAGDQYATHLVAVARSQVRYATAIGMADPGGLADRVGRVLNGTLNRSRFPRIGLLGLASVALLALIPVSTVGFRSEKPVVPKTDELLEILAENDDPRERRMAAWWLGEHESSRAVRPLIRSLSDESADVRLAAGWALGEIKDDRAIDPLIETLDDPDPLTREMAALALGEIENADAIDALHEAATRSPELAKPVIWALGEIDTRQARRLRRELFDELGQREYDNQQVWAGDLPIRHTRHGRKLARGTTVSDDLDELLADLQSADPDVRRDAAFGIGILGVRGDLDTVRPVEPLLDMLRDPEPSVRAMAIWSLDEINPSRWRHYH